MPDHLFAHCQGNGGDICFSSDAAGHNQIPCEIVWINTATKQAEIWVPVTLSTAADVTIYVWYSSKSGTLGQPAANAAYGSQAVWSTVGNMLAVYHFGSASSLSTLNSVDGTTGTNHGVTAATGVIGGAGAFASASSQYVDTGENPNPAAFTVQSWINTSDITDLAFVFGGSNGGINGLDFYVYSGGITAQIANTSLLSTARVTGVSGFTAGAWANLAATWNGSNAELAANWGLYFNATSQTVTMAAAATTSMGTPTVTGKLGRYDGAGGEYYVNGSLDELRFHSTARSGNYLATDYAIQTATNLVNVGSPTAAWQFFSGSFPGTIPGTISSPLTLPSIIR